MRLNILIVNSDLIGRNKPLRDENVMVKNISIKQSYGCVECGYWDVTIVNVPKDKLSKDWIMCLENYSNHVVYMREHEYWSLWGKI